jgi:hypothetical protein
MGIGDRGMGIGEWARFTAKNADRKLDQSWRLPRLQVLRFYVMRKDQPQRGELHTARGNAPGAGTPQPPKKEQAPRYRGACHKRMGGKVNGRLPYHPMGGSLENGNTRVVKRQGIHQNQPNLPIQKE